MKNHINMSSVSLAIGLGTAILVAVGAGGCSTAREDRNAKAATGSPAVAAETARPTPQPEAAQNCRAILRHIEGAKRMWALEKRKQDSEVPTDADLFGPGRYLPQKPKCPSGGTYTLRAVEDAPLCSVAGHTY